MTLGRPRWSCRHNCRAININLVQFCIVGLTFKNLAFKRNRFEITGSNNNVVSSYLAFVVWVEMWALVAFLVNASTTAGLTSLTRCAMPVAGD